MSTPMILLVAMVIDAALGEPTWLWSRLPHPAVVMGRAVAALDRRLNTGRARIAKGSIAVALLMLAALMLGHLISLLGPAAEVIALAILLAHRSLVDHVAAVATGLRMSLTEGRQAVALIVSRDTARMDGPAVARSAIESAAENLSDGVIAPAFWFFVAGLPGVLIYKVVNTADSMIGYRTPQYEHFGKAAARIDDVMNWIPARLTCALLALTGGAAAAWRAIAAEARLHRSPNAGWPEAAMARALGVALSGPRAYDGRMQDFPWVNPAGARHMGPADIDAAIAQLWRAWNLLLFCAFVLGVLN